MRGNLFILLVILLTILSGCTRTSAHPQATVTLKDGTTFNGAVTNSSPSEITLQAATGESRTYPMSQVASVNYATVDQSQAAPAPAPAPVAATAPSPPAPQAPPPPAELVRTIPAGVTIEVRNNEAIESETAQPGQQFSGVIARDIRATDGTVAIPRGSSAMLVVRAASGQGKLQGRSDLVVDVAAVTINGRQHRLETSDFVERGREGVGENRRTGEFAGGGAALGGIIGALAGGGKGAAIGLLSGAGAGVAAQGVTRGKPVRIAPETLLSFRLVAPVRIRALP